MEGPLIKPLENYVSNVTLTGAENEIGEPSSNFILVCYVQFHANSLGEGMKAFLLPAIG